MIHVMYCVLIFLVVVLSCSQSSLLTLALKDLENEACMKSSEMHRNEKKIYPFDLICASRIVKAQPYLSHVTPRNPRSVHDKFHADWSKTVGARGIHPDRHTESPPLILY